MATKQKTAHEKKVELAKAAAPRYGIYIDGTASENLKEILQKLGETVVQVLHAPADDRSKEAAIKLLGKQIAGVENCSISDTSITME